MACRCVVEQLTTVDCYVLTKLLPLVVKHKNQLIADDALHSVDTEEYPVHVGVVDFAAKWPAVLFGASMQWVEELIERCYGRILHRGQICTRLNDETRLDLDHPVSGTDNINLRRKQAMFVEILADCFERCLVRSWIGRI